MDIFLEEDGSISNKLTKDSVWNYHCWNEAWMTRPDLPVGFGARQAVDSTPQENSDGIYRCGPASVQAIKHSHVCFQFDAPFVFAEVNSDLIYITAKKDGTHMVETLDTTHIGKLIVTQNLKETAYMILLILTNSKKVKRKGSWPSRQRSCMDLRRPSTQRVWSNRDQTWTWTLRWKMLCWERTSRSPSPSRTTAPTVTASLPISRATSPSTLGSPRRNSRRRHSTWRWSPYLVQGAAVVGLDMVVTVEFTNPLKEMLQNVWMYLEGPGVIRPKRKMFRNPVMA
ncbi:coagulation factor XIII A chain-like isoform X2 [Ictidomys tridecemlineatus]